MSAQPLPRQESRRPAPAALELFHPRIRDYFRATFGTPTDIQERAWPAIAAGKHVLVSAPTGSGKTLTAFLWALDRLFTGEWPAGSVQVLYISPLKALNTDVRQQPRAAAGRHFRGLPGRPASGCRCRGR